MPACELPMSPIAARRLSRLSPRPPSAPPRPWLARLLPVVLMAAMLAPAGGVRAAPMPWPEASFTYLADNQKLTEVLSRFARSFGLEIQLSDLVRAGDVAVSGKITTASPTEFLNQMGAAYGLTWFVQNGVLYVSRSSERATQAIVPPGISSASLKSALNELGIVEAKFGWGEIPDRGMALVSGPPAYVRLVAQVVADLPVMAPDQQVQVFRLKHAPVDDRTIFFRDKQIVTSGIATILRGLIAGDNSASGTNVYLAELATPLRGGQPLLSTLAPLTGAINEAGANGANGGPTGPGSGSGVNTAGGARRASAPGTPLVSDRPVIQADSRLNSVIIRDRPERMPIYRELINVLDVPTQLIEIEAMIVDVNSSDIRQLGIDWSARAGSVNASVTAGGPLSDTATAATINLGGSSALSIGGSSAVITDVASRLLARINALESRGAARIMSRPSVLTMDNLGALIDLSETFYIQSVGERVSNVTPVSVGVTLKVTPHVVEENGRRSIQLVVDIEDGAIQDRQIQSLPTVRRSTIGTQAVMGERESLLIGGFNSEQDIRQKDGVPGLGNLPFFGFLFSKTSNTVERRERLFVITPKIVSLDGQVAQSGALRQAPAAAQDLPLRTDGAVVSGAAAPANSHGTGAAVPVQAAPSMPPAVAPQAPLPVPPALPGSVAAPVIVPPVPRPAEDSARDLPPLRLHGPEDLPSLPPATSDAVVVPATSVAGQALPAPQLPAQGGAGGAASGAAGQSPVDQEEPVDEQSLLR